MKREVLVSRKWHQPEIEVIVCPKEISIGMDLADYNEAVIKEIGPIWSTWSQATFAQKFREASLRVIKEMKDQTANVVTKP